MTSKIIQVALIGTILSVAANAKDAISAEVSNFVTTTPVVAVNGNPYAGGTFAVGTIQLFYDVHASQFTAGTFAKFDLTLQAYQPNTTGQTPSYPVALNLSQAGNSGVILVPAPAAFSVTGLGWQGTSTVTVSISQAAASDPQNTLDGAEIVGNLKITAGPKLDTTTNVQIHIRLVHPASCLKVYEFMTTQDLVTPVSSLQVSLFKSGPKAGTVQGTTPPQLSHDMLIVNTCASDLDFDLTIHNDPSFGDQGANSVRLFTKTGATDPGSFDIADFGAGVPKGQNHCLGNIHLPANDSMLITDHLSILSILAAQLPSSAFSFSAAMATAGSGCPGNANGLATPNPANLSIPYSIN